MIRPLALILFALLVIVPTTAVSAAPLSQDCRTHTHEYQPGKTEAGFEATATDGCHRVHWTGSIGQGAGSGTLTFRTIGNIQPTEPGYILPSPAGGPQSYCEYRAAHEANLYFTNLFGMPPGTEVTVSYRCD